jgi:hypothetical protein
MSSLRKLGVGLLALACIGLGNGWSAYGGERNPKFLTVNPERNVDKALLPVHQKVATALTKANLPPPACRIEHFKFLDQPDRLKFRGWHGFITNVEPVPGGILVTLRISPIFEQAMSSETLIEQYSIINGVIDFVGAQANPSRPRFTLGL